MPSIQDSAKVDDDDSVNTKKSSNIPLTSAPSFATIDSTNIADLHDHAARILQAEGLLLGSTGSSGKNMKPSKKQSRRMRKSGEESDSLVFSPDNFFAAMSDNEVGNSTTTPSPTRTSGGGRKVDSPTSVIPAVNSVPRPSALKASTIIRPCKPLASPSSQSYNGSDDSSNDIREKFSPSISVEDDGYSEFVKSRAKSPLDRLHDLFNCLTKETLINHLQHQCTEGVLEKSVIDQAADASDEYSEDDDDTYSGTFATNDDEDTYASSLRSRRGRRRRGRSLTARHGYNSDGESISPRASRSRSTIDSNGTSSSRTKSSRRSRDEDDASGGDMTVAESVLSKDHSTWKSMTNATDDGSKSSNGAVLEPPKDPRESGYFKVRSERERLLL